MRLQTFTQRSRVPVPVEALFAWHTRPGALERLIPPWEPVRVVERVGGIQDGSRVILRIGPGPVALRWVAVHRGYIQNRQFVDEQVEGPFTYWVHAHRFEPEGLDASVLEDRLEYGLPCGPVGRLLAGRWVRQKLQRMFAYRHAVTRGDLMAHWRAGTTSPMHIAITGSRGLVGSALVPFLTTGGHRVTRLVRSSPDVSEVMWSPEHGVKELPRLEGVEAVIHLAGENIAAGRWTPTRKEQIRRSRVDGTRTLSESLACLRRPPRVLVSASAIGFYGDRGDEVLSEESPPGSGFLAEVCQAWEAAAEPAERAGVRVVHLRFGMVLSPAAGALRKMLLPFRLGLGGPVGSGCQFVSWISLDDAIGAVLHAVCTHSLAGPVNAVAPGAVTNAEFCRVLGRVLSRPAVLPLPAGVARLLFGELADGLLLASARVAPTRLETSGYQFRHPALEGALRHLLGRAIHEGAVNNPGLHDQEPM